MPRVLFDLGGDSWLMGQAHPDAPPQYPSWADLETVAEWLPATVPGNVRGDLLRAKRISDLHYGTQVEDSLWVEGRYWWYRRDFLHTASDSGRVFLDLRGVDYVWDLFLNGQHLGRHEGMFSPRRFDITRFLGAENRLAVRITGSDWLPQDRSSRWERLLCQIEARLNGLAGRYPLRRDTLKCQMGFGWDFAPPLRTMGIWDDVHVVATGSVTICDVVTGQEFRDGTVEVSVGVDLDALQPLPVRLRITLTAEDGDPGQLAEKELELDGGTSRHTIKLVVCQPHLWWPWDHGQPYLYRLHVDVWHGGEVLDGLTQSLGLRQVELDNWQLSINGQRVYARGANWVPADILPGRVSEADYQGLLTLARDANMNMLRVWGGGLREKRAFYDLCDRMGMLVWQEFPFACAFLARFPRSADYLQLVDREARGIVRDLRSHPSVVLWCGGNEFDPGRNEPLVSTLERAVREEDAARPFVPASPATGDSHNWNVWHSSAPPAAYISDRALFASEFGLQSPPASASLRRFIPPEQLWPPGPAWTYHGAGIDKLERYARPFLAAGQGSLEGFVKASQESQAHGLQIAIEHYRRRKADGCGGVLVWQLNEPWPAISWALVDYSRRCKPAYERVRRLFNAQLVSVHYPIKRYQDGDRFCPTVWVINDAHVDFPDCDLKVSLWDADRVLVEQVKRKVDVEADAAQIAGRFCWTLPAGGGWQVTCRVTHQDNVLTTNRYDLTAFDGAGPDLGQRLWRWMSRIVRPA